MCSYDILFGLVLEDIIARTQRREVNLGRVPHIVVWIPALDLVEDCKGLLELVFNEAMLHLQRIVQLHLRVRLVNALDLVDRQR